MLQFTSYLEIKYSFESKYIYSDSKRDDFLVLWKKKVICNSKHIRFLYSVEQQ